MMFSTRDVFIVWWMMTVNWSSSCSVSVYFPNRPTISLNLFLWFCLHFWRSGETFSWKMAKIVALKYLEFWAQHKCENWGCHLPQCPHSIGWPVVGTVWLWLVAPGILLWASWGCVGCLQVVFKRVLVAYMVNVAGSSDEVAGSFGFSTNSPGWNKNCCWFVLPR